MEGDDAADGPNFRSDGGLVFSTQGSLAVVVPQYVPVRFGTPNLVACSRGFSVTLNKIHKMEGSC